MSTVTITLMQRGTNMYTMSNGIMFDVGVFQDEIVFQDENGDTLTWDYNRDNVVLVRAMITELIGYNSHITL